MFGRERLGGPEHDAASAEDDAFEPTIFCINLGHGGTGPLLRKGSTSSARMETQYGRLTG